MCLVTPVLFKYLKALELPYTFMDLWLRKVVSQLCYDRSSIHYCNILNYAMIGVVYSIVTYQIGGLWRLTALNVASKQLRTDKAYIISTLTT